MQKIKFKAVGTTAVQISEGRDVDAYQDENGVIYIPVFGVPASGGGVSAAVTNKTEKPAAGKKEKEVAEEAPKKGRTTKKAEKENDGGGELYSTMLDILTRVDDGDIGMDDAEAELQELTADKKAQKALVKVLEKFGEDSSLAVEDVANEMVAVLGGEEVEDAGEAEGDAEEVEAADLEIGDRVTVSFEGSEDFEDGEYIGEVVKKARGGKVVFQFDDDEEGDTMNYDDSFMVRILRHLEEEEEEAPAKPAAKKRGRK